MRAGVFRVGTLGAVAGLGAGTDALEFAGDDDGGVVVAVDEVGAAEMGAPLFGHGPPVKARGGGGPLPAEAEEGFGGPSGGGHVVEVAGKAVVAVGDDDFGGGFFIEGEEAGDGFFFVGAVQAAIRVAPDFELAHAEDAAGGAELGFAHTAQLLGGADAVRLAGLAAGEGGHAHGDAAAGVEGDGGRISEGFVVRMGVDVQNPASARGLGVHV